MLGEEGGEDGCVVVGVEVVVVDLVVVDVVEVVVWGVVGLGFGVVLLFFLSFCNRCLVFCWNLFHHDSVVGWLLWCLVGVVVWRLVVELVVVEVKRVVVEAVVKGEVGCSVVIWFHQVLGNIKGVGDKQNYNVDVQ